MTTAKRIVKRVAYEQSYVQGSENRVCKAKSITWSINEIEDIREINGRSFIINVIINNFLSVPILIDNECDCLAAISNSIVRKASLPRIKIAPRKLTEAISNSQKNDFIFTDLK